MRYKARTEGEAESVCVGQDECCPSPRRVHRGHHQATVMMEMGTGTTDHHTVFFYFWCLSLVFVVHNIP